jgi:hypothetical protein
MATGTLRATPRFGPIPALLKGSTRGGIAFVHHGAGPGCWAGVHPVAFGPDGTGRQADLGGGFFGYPPDAFGRGLIAGRAVLCLSARQQCASGPDTSTALKTSTTSPSSTPSATSKIPPRDR